MTVRLVDRPDPGNAYRIDRGCLEMIDEFHANGILADPERFRELDAKVASELEQARRELRDIAGREVNAGSNADLARYLYDERKLEPPLGLRYTAAGARSTDSETLKSMLQLDPSVRLVLRIRELAKLRSTYTQPLPQMIQPDGRIRTTFRHTSTETGRLTSDNPNLQNIPARTKLGLAIRDCFVAPPGRVLVSCDLSQIEMVLAGHLSGDETLLNAIRNGSDIHTLTAVNAMGVAEERRQYYIGLSLKAKREDAGGDEEWTDEERADWKRFKQEVRLPAKTVGFGILYGQKPQGAQYNIVAQGGPLLPLEQCEQMVESFFRTYPGIRRWMQLQESRATTFGCVWDMFGRVRLLPTAMSTHAPLARKAVREAGNMPIQSSAQGILKIAMNRAMELVREFRSLGFNVLPLLQIHDELVFEADDDCAEDFASALRQIMVSAVKLRVDYNASYSIARSWGQLK